MKTMRVAAAAVVLACCGGVAFAQSAQDMQKQAQDQAMKAEQEARKAVEAAKKAHAEAQKAAKDKEAEMAAQPGGQDPKAMMEAYAKAFAPSAHHKALAMMAGAWDADLWAQMDPTSPPITSKGQTVNTMVMGDRIMKQEFKGEMMGMSFEGLGYMSYNPVLEKYDSVWMDSMGGMMTTSVGTCTPDHKTWTFEGTESDPLTKQTMKVKDVCVIVDADHHTFTRYYVMPDGKEMKGMEIKYSRKAGTPKAAVPAAPTPKAETRPDTAK
jgi:hypothetical protein